MLPSPSADSPMVEELSAREREILALLADQQSDREIADKLVLSLNTVKWYARQIYGKLGVDNRRMAVQRAQELGLVGEITPLPAPQSDLPTPLTSFIGREEEIKSLRRLLTEGSTRLVTLVGPGGIGKTRLTIQLGHILVEQTPPPFADGIYFVPLAALQEWQMIVYAIAHGVGLSFQAGEGAPAQQLFSYMRAKQMLLVLDNFEHLIGAESNQWLLDLLGQSPHLKIMVTSRNQLNIYGEQLYSLGGLDMPTLSDLQPQVDVQSLSRQYGALSLFDQVVRRLRPDFQVNDSSMESMTRICRAVGGMPLAIELAASWIEVLSVEEIAAEIERGLDLLETRAHGVPDRQRSLRTVCDYSWNFLSRPEQLAMQRLSVFHGGFERAAAEAIAEVTIFTLMALTSKSWLQRGDNNRFQIHELLRQYCSERLAQEQAMEIQVRDRHSEYYCKWLSQQEATFNGAGQRAAIDAVTVELANCLDGCQWVAHHNHWEWLVLGINSLGQFFTLTGDMQNGVRAMANLLEALPAIDSGRDEALSVNGQLARGRLLTQLSALSGELGDVKANTRYMDQALAMFNSPLLSDVDTRPERARLVFESAYSHYMLNAERAIELFSESFVLYQALDDRAGMASAKLGLGRAYRTAGAPAQAREVLVESLALYEEIGNVMGQSSALGALSSIAVLQTHFADAEGYVRQSLTLIEEKDRFQRAYLLGSLASVLTHRGSFEEAEEAVQSAINIYRAEGHWMVMPNMGRLSEIYLHQGKYEQCLRQMEAIQAMLTTTDSQVGNREMMAYLHPSKQSAVALAQGHYNEAHRFAEQALAAWTPVAYSRYERASLVSRVALALRGLGRRDEAWRQLSLSLKQALGDRSYIGLLLAIATGALLEVQQGNIARGLELYTTIARQPLVSNSIWYADIAGKEIAETASKLPVEIAANARENGERADLWETGQTLADSIPA